MRTTCHHRRCAWLARRERLFQFRSGYVPSGIWHRHCHHIETAQAACLRTDHGQGIDAGGLHPVVNRLVMFTPTGTMWNVPVSRSKADFPLTASSTVRSITGPKTTRLAAADAGSRGSRVSLTTYPCRRPSRHRTRAADRPCRPLARHRSRARTAHAPEHTIARNIVGFLDLDLIHVRSAKRDVAGLILDLGSVVNAPRISSPDSRTESSPKRSSPSRHVPLNRRSMRDHFS